ncbi:MAG: radical SAM protein [Elusimicrobiales bacterium]
MPDISLWNKCNNRCIMCTNPRDYSNSDPYGNYDLKTQIKKINLYLQGKDDVFYPNHKRKDYINITGGEPTLHPNFFHLIRYFSDKFKKTPITLLTNGRRFSDETFAKKFSAITNERFTAAISIHSYRSDVFDKITGVKKSYHQTISGLMNLMKYFCGSIEIRTVVHKLNIEDLKQTILFVKDLMIAYRNWYHVIIHYEIEGVGEENRKIIKLKLSDSAKVIEEIDEDILKASNIRLYHFPLCILNPRLRRYAWKTLPDNEIIFTKKCEKCILKKKCLGLMKRYYELYGDDELKTVCR